MTKQEYAEYEKRVADFIDREGLSFLSTGTDTIPEENGGNLDPWFSWRPSACCQSPFGGNREYLFGISEGVQAQFEICEDCVYYVNYGRLDDTTMMDIE